MLQHHENEEIYKLAYEIIDNYFSGEVSICAIFWVEQFGCLILFVQNIIKMIAFTQFGNKLLANIRATHRICLGGALGVV